MTLCHSAYIYLYIFPRCTHSSSLSRVYTLNARRVRPEVHKHPGWAAERHVPRAPPLQPGGRVAPVRLHVPRGAAPARRARLHHLRPPRHSSRVSIYTTTTTTAIVAKNLHTRTCLYIDTRTHRTTYTVFGPVCRMRGKRSALPPEDRVVAWLRVYSTYVCLSLALARETYSCTYICNRRKRIDRLRVRRLGLAAWFCIIYNIHSGDVKDGIMLSYYCLWQSNK